MLPQKPHRAEWRLWSLPLILAALAGTIVPAQTRQNSVELYAQGIRQSTVADQIRAMEQYLAVAENGILKQDALEVLIWDYTRMDSAGRVKQLAEELRALNPGNPVAFAELAGDRQAPVEEGKSRQESAPRASRERIGSVRSALVALETLRKPEGMQAGDFAALRRHVEAKLEGMLGLAYVSREQYQEAKTPLQQAVASDARNAQYAYGLGLALLLAKDSDEGGAFFYLARAADLTEGTAEGRAIAEFARKRYRKTGGKDSDWNRFLLAAALPAERPEPPVVAHAPAVAAPETGSSGRPATSGNAAGTAAAREPSSAGHGSNTAPSGSASGTSIGLGAASTTSSTSSRGSRPSESTKSQAPPALPPTSRNEIASADVGRQPMIPPPPKEPEIASPNPPISLGILIETALLTNRNRPSIISTLRDVVHHLRPGDEAAILVFSNQLDFEQDLTANGELLTDAMQGLRPRRGSALLDGVGFAAGHLKRIGKNANRVLLVISDGRSSKMNPESLPLSAQINGVRIDCIGLDVDGDSGKSLLENLASSTGGQASFIQSAQDFPVVASRITYGMGLTLR
ncbi:MAG TPA: VWA domain-containing protein [Terriglobales bacterium]|nr:VWA domain-containing protein [Terriglobales bacterium]